MENLPLVSSAAPCFGSVAKIQIQIGLSHIYIYREREIEIEVNIQKSKYPTEKVNI